MTPALSTSWARCCATGAPCGRHTCSPSAAALNIETARRVIELVRSRGGRDGTFPRLVVRIDDPWQAEDWRRRHVVDDPAVFSDTVGVFKVTARELLDHALGQEADRLVLLGSSALTLALLDEVAQHRREEAVFSEPSSLDVVVVDPEAAELMADHELHQSRYGNVGVTGSGCARFEGSEASATLVRGLVADSERALVVDTREPSSSSLRAAERLAARLPGCQVLVWTDDEQGVASEALMGNLRAYGLTLLSAGEVPEDGWERIARRQHESYVAAYPGPTGTEPGRRPWPELSDFYRQSNLRQIATTMKIAKEAGRSWVRPTASSAGARPLSDAEIDALAHREHDAWQHYLTANGWRYAADAQRPPAASPEPARLVLAGRGGQEQGTQGCPGLVRAAGLARLPPVPGHGSGRDRGSSGERQRDAHVSAHRARARGAPGPGMELDHRIRARDVRRCG